MTRYLTHVLLTSLVVLTFAGSSPSQTPITPLYDAPVVQIPITGRMSHGLDYNQDGVLDGVGYWWDYSDEYNIQGWRYDPADGYRWTFRFTFDGDYAGGFLPFDAGEFSGNQGFAVAHRLEGLRFYRIQQNGVVTNWYSPGTQGIEQLHLGDYNGDGLGDLAALSGSTLYLHLSQPFGLPPLESTFTVLAGDQMTAADLDGDGADELFVWNLGAVQAYRFVHGYMDPIFFFAPVGPGHVTAADIDGDLDTDVVFFELPPDPADARYQVFRQTATDTFVAEPVQAGGPAERLVDLDGDGDKDGICCGGGGGPYRRLNGDASNFFISLNDGQGGFDPAYFIPSMGAIRLVGAEDLNQDGYTDLVGGRVVYYGTETSYSNPGTHEGPSYVVGQQVLDADGDGDDDLFFGRAGESYWTNTGDGNLVPSTIPLPRPPLDTEYMIRETAFNGDWNGDGTEDIMVESWEVGGSFLGMRLLLNHGGLYTDVGDPGLYALNLNDPDDYALDVDGDGDQDLCCRSGRNGLIWINDGEGNFHAGPTSFTDEFVLHAADFDGDQIQDVLTQKYAGTLWLGLHRGLGGGAFGPREQIQYYHSRLAAVVDMDADQDLDVVATGSGRIKIFRNDGQGNFTNYDAFNNIDFGGGFAFVEDVNDDGLLDVMMGGDRLSEGTSNIFLRTGSPTQIQFEDTYQQVFQPTAVCDMDGDGDLDAFTSRRRMVKSSLYEMPYAGSRVQYGEGLAGTDGIVPLLGAVGPFRRGSGRTYLLRNFLGNRRGGLVIGSEATETPVRGGILYTVPEYDLRFRYHGPAGQAGMGWYEFTYQNVPHHLAGMTFILQAWQLDPGAVERISLSNALRITFGEE